MYSKIIAGTMTWGSWGNNLTSSQISRLIEECVSEGVFTFITLTFMEVIQLKKYLEKLSQKVISKEMQFNLFQNAVFNT